MQGCYTKLQLQAKMNLRVVECLVSCVHAPNLFIGREIDILTEAGHWRQRLSSSPCYWTKRREEVCTLKMHGDQCVEFKVLHAFCRPTKIFMAYTVCAGCGTST